MNEKIIASATLGITRDKMNNLLLAKGKKLLTKKRFSKSSLSKAYEQQDLVKSTLLNYSTRASEIELGELQEPVWMPDYRKCCHLLNQIDEISEEIKRQKAKKLVAINDQKHQEVIEKLNQQAATKICRCEKILKGIQKIDDFTQRPEQRKIFTNILMSLAIKTQEKAKRLRALQQEDLKQKQELQKYDKNNLQASGLMNKDENDGEAEWLTEQGFSTFQQKLNQERNQEIMKIVASIQSLNTIYKDLQNIVIQQGSLLDRIDENIENTAFNIKEANEHLTKAQEYQKSPFANRVICILVLLIFFCAAILVAR